MNTDALIEGLCAAGIPSTTILVDDDWLLSKGINPETYRNQCSDRDSVVSEFCQQIRTAHENAGTSPIKYQ